MKHLLIILFTGLYILPYAQNQSTSDTIITESNGWGQSVDEATNNAIRNGVETSTGIFISSLTILENYTLVRDVIRSSTNGYCYKYDVIKNSFDKNSGLYHLNLKVYVANKRLIADVTSKISDSNKIDMSAINKLKFELSQKKQRTKSSLLYLANYIQQNYQKPIIANFDSIHILNSDQSKNTADVEFCFSFSSNQEALNIFSQQIKILCKRANQYAERNFYVIYNIKFSVKLAYSSSSFFDQNIWNTFVYGTSPGLNAMDCGFSLNNHNENSGEMLRIDSCTFSRGFSFNTVYIDKKCKPFDLKYKDIDDQFFVMKKDFCNYILGSVNKDCPYYNSGNESRYLNLYDRLYKFLTPCNSFFHFLMPNCGMASAFDTRLQNKQKEKEYREMEYKDRVNSDISYILDNINYKDNKYSDRFRLNGINLNMIKDDMLSVNYSLCLIEEPNNSSSRFRFYPDGQSKQQNCNNLIQPINQDSKIHELVIKNKIINIDEAFSDW